jgi:hypothetical protein
MWNGSILRKLCLWLTLEMGALIGVPIRPDEIERLMRAATEAKIVRSIPEDESKRGQ